MYCVYILLNFVAVKSFWRFPIKKRKIFPSDDSAKKVIWLAIQAASKKWTMPIQDWRLAMSRFMIEFGDRLNGHI
ncbi:hypothetical protein BDD26_2836 [Xenorhabdus cabanillasii]|uniref:Transposase n=1 Tax=Xenorhabdus cabanillasii TaxID=351673 RepID=A0A3D9UFD7_9GAMM|nr:hypothetical protein BDD26_2836 [Xenorhabdus cabanillasii]